jgi:uncharacterized repeat protein (TIGR01451 family)
VPPTADLGLTIAPIPPVDVGDSVSVTTTVTNAGPSAATGVVVTFPLPPALDLVSASPGQGSCSGDTTVTCALGTLPSQATVTIVLQAQVVSEEPFSIVATVTAQQPDPNPGDNTGPPAATVRANPRPRIEDEDDDPPRLTEEERQQRERTNASSLDDERTEGNVIAVQCASGTPRQPMVYFDDGEDVPYPIIVNRDGPQKVRLFYETKAQCRSITVGSYLEVSGVKQTEQLFDADAVTIRHPR